MSPIVPVATVIDVPGEIPTLPTGMELGSPSKLTALLPNTANALQDPISTTNEFALPV
jgi:hypothetical protein